MKESKKGRQIHAEVERAREKERDFNKALELSDKAYDAYIKDKDYLGAAEVLGSKTLVLKRLHRDTDDEKYLDEAVEIANKAIEIAKKAGTDEALAMPYKNLGKILKDKGEYKKAVENLQKSLDIMQSSPPERHNRKGPLSEIKAHLGFCQYMAGDKEEGSSNIREAIDELETNEEEVDYNRDVWLSGAYMMAARALRGEDSQIAKEYLMAAKDIIDANEELKLRLQDWEKLADSFSV